MADARRTDRAFVLPENFRYADSAGDSYFGVFIGLEKTRFAVECRGEAAVFATERQWAADQKNAGIDGGVKMEFTSSQYDKVLRWVLSCGRDALPLEPARLVADWKMHVKEMRKLAAG